ncbi:MAG: DUF2793 domain-containing protein [Alphaproteobacteria bacterium]
MSNTPNLALAYIAAGQAQKEVTHNDALNDLDALAQLAVLDRTLNAPPGSPATGDTYIIGASPTGAWSGFAGRVAAWYSGWRVKSPGAGWAAWARAENRLLYYTGTAWGNLATPFLEASTTWDPANLAAGAGVSAPAVTVTGAAFGDFVQVAAPYDLQGITCTGYVSAANNVVIRLHNSTGAAIDLASGSWKLRVVKA